MPISDELHDLVGNPVPSGDLAFRARERGATIKRRRLAGIVTSVVAVSVLAVPGALLVRDQSDVNGQAGSGAGRSAGVVTTTAGPGPGYPATGLVTARGGSPDAVGVVEIASARKLLGQGYAQTLVGVLVEAATGRIVGTEATFTAADGGGTVAVQWTKPTATIVVPVGPTLTAVGPPPSGAAWSGPIPAVASEVPASPAPIPTAVLESRAEASAAAMQRAVVDLADVADAGVTRSISSDGSLTISVKVVQGKAGSAKILPGKAAIAFANDLLKAG